jgi:ABC-type multidrug transport system fused ATPase/permease subunit
LQELSPSLLILDEATSTLDRKNEKEIQKTLSNLSSTNITTVVITHCLSTIRGADNIIVLGKGQVIE